jgi:rod shape-determining protein MreD
VTVARGARIALVLFVVSILQVSAFSTVSLGDASPNVLLVTLVAIALLRGAVTGAVSGFAVGLLVDVATLGTLGMTALLLTLAGFWAGRYGETTGRGRAQAPIVATLVATVFVELGGYVLDSVLGGPTAFASTLLALPAALIWNALLVYPVFSLARHVIGTPERVERAREVELLV